MNDYPRQNPAYGRLPLLMLVSVALLFWFRQVKAFIFKVSVMRMLLNRAQLKHLS